jgi:DNA-binding MarR family transcriptional regulator
MPLSKREYEILSAFRYTLRRFLAFSDAAAARVGLTQQQYQAMLAVRAHPGPTPISISELAATMLVKHHSAVGMVDRLEELGMLKRERSDGDRRKVCLRLTARGAQVFDRLAVVHRAELRRVGPGLGRFIGYFARPEGEPRPRSAGTRAHA